MYFLVVDTKFGIDLSKVNTPSIIVRKVVDMDKIALIIWKGITFRTKSPRSIIMGYVLAIYQHQQTRFSKLVIIIHGFQKHGPQKISLMLQTMFYRHIKALEYLELHAQPSTRVLE